MKGSGLACFDDLDSRVMVDLRAFVMANKPATFIVSIWFADSFFGLLLKGLCDLLRLGQSMRNNSQSWYRHPADFDITLACKEGYECLN